MIRWWPGAEWSAGFASSHFVRLSAPIDFKWLEVHSNFEAMGGDYEIFGNGRGFEKHGELIGPLVSCDAARVYRAKSRRFTQLR